MNTSCFKICRAAVAALLVLGGGCATPVGVERTGARTAYQQINASALNADEHGGRTTAVLHRYNLANVWHDDPLAAIRELHAVACRDERRDPLLALAELCFLAGELDLRYATPAGPIGARQFYGGAAIYAYLFLLGPGPDAPPTPFDREFRLACDLYNRSLAGVLIERDKPVEFDDQPVLLPVGQIRLEQGVYELPWPQDEYAAIVSADEFCVRGLSLRNRQGGLGAPIVAVRRPQPDRPISGASAGTLFVRVHGGVRDLEPGTGRAEVDLYAPQVGRAIDVDGQMIPLETDQTAAMAFILNNPDLWTLGVQAFRLGRSPVKPGIYHMQPCDPAKIPVVFVHGTMSSPVGWAEMLNTLSIDRQLSQHYQFWLYLYDTGKPIVYSARQLQDAMAAEVATCDPAGTSAAYSNMVIIGHSQGGLLTKLCATDTGDALIKALTGKPAAELEMTPEERTLVEHYLVFRPVPQVRRVVFISTPHSGSYLANSVARQVVKWLITLPADVAKGTARLLTVTERNRVHTMLEKGTPTSIDGMSPSNPIMLSLAAIPVASNITAHSIVAIQGDDQPPAGSDGVVEYKSAHVAYVDSELVVRSGHSCQVRPQVIEEVRRILLKNLEESGTP